MSKYVNATSPLYSSYVAMYIGTYMSIVVHNEAI